VGVHGESVRLIVLGFCFCVLRFGSRGVNGSYDAREALVFGSGKCAMPSWSNFLFASSFEYEMRSSPMTPQRTRPFGLFRLKRRRK
jgi:hypothetical protein